jgi:hypothetical protein
MQEVVCRVEVLILDGYHEVACSLGCWSPVVLVQCSRRVRFVSLANLPSPDVRCEGTVYHALVSQLQCEIVRWGVVP